MFEAGPALIHVTVLIELPYPLILRSGDLHVTHYVTTTLTHVTTIVTWLEMTLALPPSSDDESRSYGSSWVGLRKRSA